MLKKISALILTLCLIIILVGCGESKEKSEINVSIAASLKEAMDEIKIDYEKNHNVNINLNASSSGLLKKQIVEGAKVDIFFSADEKYGDDLLNEGLVKADDIYKTVRNSIVVIGNEDIKSLDDLINYEGKIAIGEENTVPAGRYALQAFRHEKLEEVYLDRFVYAQNVTAVKNYVENGEAEFGVVYKTDALNLKNSEIIYEVPLEFHNPVNYSIMGIKDKSEEGTEFLKYLNSKDAKTVLEKYGFVVE